MFRERSLRLRKILLLAAAAWTPLLHGATGNDAAEPGPRPACAGTTITIRGLAARDVTGACRAVADALAFLAANGLDTSAPAELVFVDKLPHQPPGTVAFGCHRRAEQQIYMLPLAACRALASDLPVDEPVYHGLVAHEVAHYVAHANFRTARPTRVGHEYIAYGTMFATMTAEARERVLGLFPGTGFQSEREIGLTFYLLSPHMFGAHAYRHFLRPGNGAAFIQRILSGLALDTEDPP